MGVEGPNPSTVVGLLELLPSKNTNRESMAYRSFKPSEFDGKSVRKVTTGIASLWQPSFHSDVALDSLMSALPVIVRQNSPSVGLVTH
ncbi:hypothetical protein Ddye_023459 [Dipteronia dyeriana]|uniref:Uncharacterized protein n=1 Tax=Dipteronia dyeriana TaxID=168575 RepID=A0AAD9TT43_9ROSI|nr:hypothetical protein Ddye_023459 [Dipteronia dyeriana]